jgi:hypothetical protein
MTLSVERDRVHQHRDDLFAELDRRAAVVFIHPARLGLNSLPVTKANLTWPIGAPFEDTLWLLQLMQVRMPERFPQIKFISSHLGGCLPFLMSGSMSSRPGLCPARNDRVQPPGCCGLTQ